jgi:hypothetical protein
VSFYGTCSGRPISNNTLTDYSPFEKKYFAGFSNMLPWHLKDMIALLGEVSSIAQ